LSLSNEEEPCYSVWESQSRSVKTSRDLPHPVVSVPVPETISREEGASVSAKVGEDAVTGK
jgi:hypothetical protein